MSFLYRLKLAFDTPIGPLLKVALLLLAMLLFFYLILKKKQRMDIKKGILDKEYFRKLSAILPDCKLNHAQYDLFAKKARIEEQNKSYHVCLIPFQSLAMQEMTHAFINYQEQLKQYPETHLLPYTTTVSHNSFIAQLQLSLSVEENCFLTLEDHYLDKGLKDYEKEQLLHALGNSLSHLHKLSSDRGQALFHGLLLPSSLLLAFNRTKELSRFFLLDHGFYCAIPFEKSLSHLKAIKQGKITITPFCQKSLRTHWEMLAPEQKDPTRFHQIGPCSDFYTFGALSLFLFTNKPFKGTLSVDWSLVPSNITSFLKACLEDNPKNRPQNFITLHNYVENPDFDLCTKTLNFELGSVEPQEEPESSDDQVMVLRDFIQKKSLTKSKSFTNKDEERLFRTEMAVGTQALKDNKWVLAIEAFSNVLTVDKDNVSAHVGKAIAYHELNMPQDAEAAYRRAHSLDPKQAKVFRSQVAFRI